MFVPYYSYVQGSCSLWLLYTFLGEECSMYIGLLPVRDTDDEGNEYASLSLIPEEVHIIHVPQTNNAKLSWIHQIDWYSNKRFRQYLNSLYIPSDDLHGNCPQIMEAFPLDSERTYVYTPNSQLTCIFFPFYLSVISPCPAVNTATFRLVLRLQNEGLM